MWPPQVESQIRTTPDGQGKSMSKAVLASNLLSTILICQQTTVA